MTERILKDFDIVMIHRSGQCFRMEQTGEHTCTVIAGDRCIEILQEGGRCCFSCEEEEFEGFWKPYFDLDRDYAAICENLKKDALVRETIDEYYGIRILNQEPWEALVSFIISQQNNIKRIKGIIKRLCDTYGEEIRPGWHAFPSCSTLSALSVGELEAIGLGYRAKYVKKLADDVACGAIDLATIKAMDLEDAKKALLSIYGVGEKVANCTLLFGFQFIRCFPVDVWMKRVLAFYPNGLPDCFKGAEGIAQQYLFHWARNNL